ncbi:hypothetical protein Zmor_004825 [Zophobas morio]|uniref:Uncharacterized protein n=1 Tax=Zophobas morio TaxID=2755281 RepID=A0AA38IWK7_9CUCU|nr:hypothetical protein Zmor_004825 [Zophobas morio]
MGSGRGRHTWGIVAAGRSLTSRGELRSHYAAGCVGNDYHKTTTARLSVTTKVGLPATLKARRVHCGFIVNMPRASGSGAGSRRANGVRRLRGKFGLSLEEFLFGLFLGSFFVLVLFLHAVQLCVHKLVLVCVNKVFEFSTSNRLYSIRLGLSFP